MNTSRQRKTKDPCQVCYLHKTRCICHLIPVLDLKTRVALIIHAKELKRTTNTGRLAIAALVNSEMRVRGASREALNLTDLAENARYRSVLFYPSDDALVLSADFVASDPRPVQLIVPDGNWRQASKVHYRHPELRSLPRVMIAETNARQTHMRAETTEHGMATLEAIAKALAVVEGVEVGRRLMELYDAKLEQTLASRGVKA